MAHDRPPLDVDGLGEEVRNALLKTSCHGEGGIIEIQPHFLGLGDKTGLMLAFMAFFGFHDLLLGVASVGGGLSEGCPPPNKAPRIPPAEEGCPLPRAVLSVMVCVTSSLVFSTI